VVLQVLFTQQNQRVKNDWPNCFASAPLYSRICIGSPQRGQGSPSPGMTTDFLHFRFPVNVCAPPRYFRPQKTRTPARRERSRELALSKSELELWRHVTIGWHVAVDFKTDADFNQNGCRPSHSCPPFGSSSSGKIIEPKNTKPQVSEQWMTASHRRHIAKGFKSPPSPILFLRGHFSQHHSREHSGRQAANSFGLCPVRPFHR
jgi:hypothetical protein